MKDLKDASAQKVARTLWFKRAIFWLGLACCFQFLIFGLVGVVRGYSVQSWAPAWIFLAGFFLLLPFQSRHKGASFFSSLCLIVFAVSGASQGRHQKRGEELYKAGSYEEAMTELRREIDTWYLRLTFNHNEAASLYQIAECQSQLERFGEARETYRKIEETFRGYYKDRARVAGTTVETTLTEIEGLENDLAAAEDDSARVQVHFDLALTYRKLTCTAKAIEHYEIIQKLEVPDRVKESAKKYADQLR